DLNKLYRNESALHERDGRYDGFQWLIGDDQDNSVYAWSRHGESGELLLVAHNFTPVPRPAYRIGILRGGIWRVILNSDSELYAGSNAGSGLELRAEDDPSHGQPFSLAVDLPPLGALILKPSVDR